MHEHLQIKIHMHDETAKMARAKHAISPFLYLLNAAERPVPKVCSERVVGIRRPHPSAKACGGGGAGAGVRGKGGR